MEKISTAPGMGRPLFQRPVNDTRKRSQFESDKKDLIKSVSNEILVHKNYHYFLSNAMLIDLKDPKNPGDPVAGYNYKTYIAIPGDQVFFNFFEFPKYNLWEAINAAMTLVNCVNCFDCEMCVNCRNCVDARGLVDLDNWRTQAI